ncbi:MAG: AAA family ATPase, partial [Halodesulfurarchaeum sp.]
MHLRGTVTEVGAVKTVSTQHGERDLCEIRLADADRGETRVTLWGKWTETAAVLDPGMELSVRNAAEREWDGEVSYETTGDSTVVVEPGFLVDVTDLRSWVQCPRLYYLNK